MPPHQNVLLLTRSLQITRPYENGRSGSSCRPDFDTPPGNLQPSQYQVPLPPSPPTPLRESSPSPPMLSDRRPPSDRFAFRVRLSAAATVAAVPVSGQADPQSPPHFPQWHCAATSGCDSASHPTIGEQSSPLKPATEPPSLPQPCALHSVPQATDPPAVVGLACAYACAVESIPAATDAGTERRRRLPQRAVLRLLSVHSNPAPRSRVSRVATVQNITDIRCTAYVLMRSPFLCGAVDIAGGKPIKVLSEPFTAVISDFA